MVGTWKLELSEAAKKQMPASVAPPDITVEFKQGGTFAANVKMFGKENKAERTYTLTDKSLTMITKTEDGKPSTEKPETVTLSDDMKSFEVPNSAGMGKMVKQ